MFTQRKIMIALIVLALVIMIASFVISPVDAKKSFETYYLNDVVTNRGSYRVSYGGIIGSYNDRPIFAFNLSWHSGNKVVAFPHVQDEYKIRVGKTVDKGFIESESYDVYLIIRNIDWNTSSITFDYTVIKVPEE